MFENSVVCLVTVSFLLFCCGTIGPWASPELGKLNSTDDGILNGTLTVEQESWIGSLAILGSVLGTIIAGFLVDYLGRKKTLLIIPLPLIASYLMLAFSNKLYLIYIARLMAGVPMGSLYVLLPIYVGEIATNDHRGVISGLFGFCVEGSHILTYAAGTYMTLTSFNIMLSLFPVLYIPLFMYWGVESPHYYIKHNKEDEAKAVIRKIRNKSNDKEREQELQYLRVLLNNEERGTLMDIFRHRGTRKAFIVMIMLFTFTNFSGRASLQTYTQQIFEISGTNIAPEICAIILGVAQLVAGLFTPILINNMGRKTLLLASNILTAFGYSTLALFFYFHDQGANLESIKYAPLFSVIFSIVSCSAGMGAITMVFLSELFPNSIKGLATSICACYSWILSFAVAKIFPVLADSIGAGLVFFGFMTVCIVAIPFTLFFVIETKGKSLKEILEAFNK